MPAWSATIETPDRLFLAFLFVGHIAADFFVQTSRVAVGKRTSARWLLWHALLTWLTHLVLVFPFWSAPVIAGVTALGAFHLAVDALTARVVPSWNRGALGFVADQGAHLASILVAWRVLAPLLSEADAVPWVATAARWGIIAAGIIFNVKGGTAIVRRVLENYPQVLPRTGEGEADEYAMGRTIGHLERFLVFTFVLLGEWGALGFVVAAKSIARFRELSSQRFADYYLIGTLTSISVALATGLVARLVLFF